MENLDDFFSYDHLLVEPLKKTDWHVENVSWRRKDVSWDRFDAVIVRSPWDYHHDPEAFIKALKMIDASEALLENSLKLIRWNMDKHYLRDLETEEFLSYQLSGCPNFQFKK